MRNKKMLLIILVVIFIIMLIPIPNRIKDGGSVEYNALLYQYTKIHRLNEKSVTGYEDGWNLKILGIQVGGETSVDALAEQKNVDGIFMKVKEDTITSKGATFILENSTDEEYSYGEPYTIERYENQTWKELDTLTGSPLSWNEILYNLKANEEIEININWSYGYGELKSGTYRLVKSDIRKSKSSESRTYTVYAEIYIK